MLQRREALDTFPDNTSQAKTRRDFLVLMLGEGEGEVWGFWGPVGR